MLYPPSPSVPNVAIPNPLTNVQPRGQIWYTCGDHNHYTTLCQCQKTQKSSCDHRSSERYDKSPRDNSWRHKNNRHRSSQSPSGHSHHCTPSHSSSHSTSHSPSLSASPCQSEQSHHWHPPSGTYQDSIEIIPAPSLADNIETSTYPKESSLLTERASDGQVSFYTCQMLPTKNGTKTMTIKIDPGSQVKTIPLSQYWKMFPHKLTETRYPKPGTLILTAHTWIVHDGTSWPM